MACERVKEFLSQSGHEFLVKNVDEDDAAYDELMAKGWRTVPMTVIGDRAITGYDPHGLADALRARTKPSD
jgi:glutaredoxin